MITPKRKEIIFQINMNLIVNVLLCFTIILTDDIHVKSSLYIGLGHVLCSILGFEK